jgi:N-dimethylarginine dimethylaminohydrolase
VAGAKVETIEPVPGLEDMVFAANQVFVGAHEGVGKFIVPSRMRHASRQREVAHYVDWFRGGYKRFVANKNGIESCRKRSPPNWTRVRIQRNIEIE